ncbi:hypothetical protein BDW60DRAFT_180666 [Aspergillus nidulans var. acristatus]
MQLQCLKVGRCRIHVSAYQRARYNILTDIVIALYALLFIVRYCGVAIASCACRHLPLPASSPSCPSATLLSRQPSSM